MKPTVLRTEGLAPEPVPFQFFVPIAKVDQEQRLVTGVVTQEILDKQGDIVDYETAKAFFTDDALWPGNMREMHQPKAVGKKVSVECDDANKTITLTSRVSKGAPDTWEKVLDKTLSFYSIGGNGERVNEVKDGKVIGKRLFLKSLVETSYVDNGACPTAKFEIVKTVDGQLIDAEPAETVDATPVIEKATAALDAALAAATPAAKPATTVLVFDTPGSVRGAMKALLQLPAVERVVRKTAITEAATAAGAVFVLELAPIHKGGPEPYDIDAALAAISFVNRLMSDEYWEARYAVAGASDEQKAQIALLKSACDALLAFLQAEYEAQFTPEDASGAPVLDLSDVLDDDSLVEMFARSLDVVRKSGARHSKGDLEMIQKVHDLSGSLGAACKDMDEDVDAAKVATFLARKGVADALKAAGWTAAAPPTFAEKVIEPTEDVKKLQTALEAAQASLTAQEAVVAEKAKTIAALEEKQTAIEKRMEAIEKAPRAGGPVRNAHAADKSLGGPDGHGGDEHTDGDRVKALQDLAASSTDDTIKSACSKEIIKLTSRAGVTALSLGR